MRNVYISNGITGIGGLERVLSVKASFFSEVLGYEVFIITLNEAECTPFYPFSPRISFCNVQTQSKGLAYLQSYVQGINRWIDKINPDVICVCDDGIKGLYIPLWIHRGKSRLIYERHASLQFCTHPWQRVLMQLGGKLYHKIVVLTQYNAKEWHWGNIEVIPNPLSLHPKTVSSLQSKRIICVGSLSENKGYDLLIKAWSNIASRYPDWSIHIYGKGNSSPYRQAVENAGLTQQIEFHSPTDQIEEEYIASSMLVLPSRSEGFGMVLIEAMSCGLPCVSFDCPSGPRDIISHGEDGFLVKPQDTDELGKRITQLIESEELRKKMGQAARKNSQRYKMEEIAPLWEKVFKCK